MKVRNLMTADVAVCHVDEPMVNAARIMWESDCGFVPVVEESDDNLVGDRKYGYRPRGDGSHQQLLLHAWRLRFRHPFECHEIAVEADVPEGFPQPQK